jgi:hypothetical protein
MIKLKNLLTETIYGNQAIVYHRTEVEDLADKIYTSGFKPGGGAMYGKACYATYDLESQEEEDMFDRYGNVIVKFSVDLTGFMFFDWSEFVRTPLYSEKLSKSTKETFIQDQITYYKISMKKPFEQKKTKFTSNHALFVYNNSDLTRKVAGIVFTGETDGKVLACYDVNRLRPISFRIDDDEWIKGELTKDFVRKTTIPANYNPKQKSIRKNSNGTIDILRDLRDNDLEKYASILPLIRIIEGNLILSKKSLGNLPDLSKSTVKGDVYCAYNKLTTLKGAPMKVEGYFRCQENLLTTLEGAPVEAGNFGCSSNQLTTLKGGPIKVAGSFSCDENQLTSLEGAPEKIVDYFNCRYNKLTSLKGAPEIIKGDFNCSGNQLTTLLGGPSIVTGNFMCMKNQLTTLKGGPIKVAKSLDCSNNNLTSLKGAPMNIEGNFVCSDNQLTSLKGGPESVKGYFNCINNKLTTLDGFPKEVGGNFEHSSSFTKEEILAVCDVKGRIIKYAYSI